MREIKFRAFDKRFKNFDFGRGDLLLRINYDDFSGPEQFTGLYDRNGKEIYHGDIVKDIETKNKYEVLWVESMAKFSFNRIDFRGRFYDFTSNDSISYIEVIGNIHENPELLK